MRKLIVFLAMLGVAFTIVYAVPARLVEASELVYVGKYIHILPPSGKNITIETDANISVRVPGNFSYIDVNRTIIIQHGNKTITINIEKFKTIANDGLLKLKQRLLQHRYIREERIGEAEIIPVNSTHMLVRLPASATCRIIWIIPVNITITSQMLVDINGTMYDITEVRPWWSFLCTAYS